MFLPFADKESPVITSDLTVIQRKAIPGDTLKTVFWETPVVTDNSGQPVTLVSNKQPGDSFPIGTTVVTYYATDEYGNSAVFNFNIIITSKIRYNM